MQTLTINDGNVLNLSNITDLSIPLSSVHHYLRITSKFIYLDPTGANNFNENNKIIQFETPIDSEVILTDGQDTLSLKPYPNMLLGTDNDEEYVLDAEAGGSKFESVFAAGGNDRIESDSTSLEQSMISGGSGEDELKIFADSTQSIYFNVAKSNIEIVYGNESADFLDASVVRSQVINGYEDFPISKLIGVFESTNLAVKLYGYASNDRLLGGAGDDFLHGGTGEDVLIGNSGVDRIHAEERGFKQADYVSGGSGDDFLHVDLADLSQGYISGDEGFDTLFVYSEESDFSQVDLYEYKVEAAFGNVGADTLDASRYTHQSVLEESELNTDNYAGNHIALYGKSGDDNLIASDTTSYLDGGAGDDLLISGTDKNFLIGGLGADVYVLNVSQQRSALIYDFHSTEAERDTLDLSQFITDTYDPARPFDFFKLTDKGLYLDSTGQKQFTSESLIARWGEKSELDGVIRFKLNQLIFDIDFNLQADLIEGTAGDDHLLGGEGSQIIHGFEGNDVLDGDGLTQSNSTDSLYGHSGDDKLIFDKQDLQGGVVDGGSGVDTGVIRTSASQSITIDMSMHNLEVLFSGSGNETIDASNVQQKVKIYSAAGDDVVTGSAFSDYLDSGAGDDLIVQSTGNDFISSGQGRDIYRISQPMTQDNTAQVDKWYDIDFTKDIIDLSSFIPNDVDVNRLNEYLGVTNEGLFIVTSDNSGFAQVAKFLEKSFLDDWVQLKLSDEQFLSFNRISYETKVLTFDNSQHNQQQPPIEPPVVTVQYILYDLPQGTTVTNAEEIDAGRYLLPNEDLTSISLLPPLHSDESFEAYIDKITTSDGVIQLTETKTLFFEIEAIADKPLLSAHVAQGFEDKAIALSIDSSLVDTDGSEFLALEITGFPQGVSFNQGELVDQTLYLNPEDLVGLTMTPPTNFHGEIVLSIKAIATENANLDKAYTETKLNVLFEAVADKARITARTHYGLEDNAIDLNLNASLKDNDGSERIEALYLYNLPQGTQLNKGVQLEDKWQLSLQDLDGLILYLPENSNQNFRAKLQVLTIEDNGSQYLTNKNFWVVLEGVADVPTLEVASAPTYEDNDVPVTISSELTDLDGSEALTFLIGDIPHGFSLNQGSKISENTYLLTPEQLDGLALIAPKHFSGQFNLSITAIATENDGDTTQITEFLPIELFGVADLATLEVRAARVNEDSLVKLDIRTALTDTDGSESLFIRIDSIPDGASFNLGELQADGSVIVESNALNDLVLTLPNNSDVDFNLLVSTISVENNGDSIESTAQVLPVLITGVSDLPHTITSQASGYEDNWIPLSIQAELADEDGSERVSFVLSNLPSGSKLSKGSYIGGGRWSLSPDDALEVEWLPPVDFSGMVELGFNAIITEREGDMLVYSEPFSVKVIPVVDGPANSRKISLSEDTAAQGFHLPNLLDRDGSEEIVSVKLAALNTIEDLILVLDDQQLLGQNSELVFTAEEYKRLLIQAPNHSNQDFKLHVEYTVVDSQTMSASFDRQLIINVKGVADSAVFSVNDASVESGQSLTFNNQVGFVIGDSGDNLLIGSQKPNVLYAGKGDDKLYFDKEDLLQGSVDGGEGRDTGRFSSQAGESSTIDMAKHNLEVLFSGAGDEIVDASLVTEKVNLYTRSGSDFVTGSVFKDYIDSGEGDDVIDSGAGSDFVASGAGVDRYIVAGIENDYVDLWYDFDFNSDIIDLSRILPKQLTAQQLTNYISLTEHELAVDVAGNANFITIAKFGSKKELAEVVELTVDGQSLVEYSLLDQSYTQTSVQLQSVSGGSSESDFSVSDVEGQLNFNLTLADLDGSESSYWIIENIPIGVSFDSAINAGGGTWVVPLQAIHSNSLKVHDSVQTQDLTVTTRVVVQENDGDIVYSADDFQLNIANLNHQGTGSGENNEDNSGTPFQPPLLTTQDAAGLEDNPIQLVFSAASQNEFVTTLSYQISGLEPGSRLSVGYYDPVAKTWTLTASQMESVTYLPVDDFAGHEILSIRAIETNEAGFYRTSSADLLVEIEPVADKPIISAHNVRVDEDRPIHLDLSAQIQDVDGSESISKLTLINLPEGFVIDNLSPNGEGHYEFNPAELTRLVIIPPQHLHGNYSLSLQAESQETLNGDKALAEKSVSLIIDSLPDTPLLSVDTASGLEGDSIELHIDAELADTDGSEQLSILIENLPDGSVLNHGLNNGDSSWTLKPEELAGLKITTEGNFSGSVDLKVSAISFDKASFTSAQEVATLPLLVEGVADTPLIDPPKQLSANEDTAIAINLNAALLDNDGSERLFVEFSSFPSGSLFNHGQLQSDGNWYVDGEYLDDLLFYPAPHYSGTFNLDLVLTALEADGDSASVNHSIGFIVTPVADTPQLVISPSQGNEDEAISLAISVSSEDSDGSERYEVTIKNIPEGASLNQGTKALNGDWVLTKQDLDGLKLTPPPNSDENITIQVFAESIDGGNVSLSELQTHQILLSPVVDSGALTLSADKALVSSGGEITITAEVIPIDTDGSEQHQLFLRVPSDWGFSNGITLSSENGYGLEEGKYINISDASSGVFNVVLNAPGGLDEKTQYSFPIFLVSEEQHGTDYVVLSKEISLEVDREYYAPEIVASDVSQQISFTQDNEFGLVLNNNYSPLSITLSDKDNSLIKQVKLQVIDAAEGDKFILPEGGTGFEFDASVNGELIIIANQGKTVTDFNNFLKELSFSPQPVFSEQSDIIKQLSVEVIDEFDFSSTDLFTSTTLYLEQEFKVDLSIDSVTKVDDYTFSFDAAVDHTVEEEFISVFITSSHLGLSLSQGVELNESKWNLTVAELNNVVVVSDSPINEDVELTFEVSYQKDPDLSLTTVDIVHFPTSLNTQVVSQQSVSDTFYYKAGMENAVYNGKEGDSKLILKDVGEINSENGWHLVTTSDASYSIDSANQNINFSESTSGFIEFDNGNEILFTDIEKVSWIS